MESYWSARGKACFVHRFRDAADVRGINRGSRLGMFSQPADYHITDREHGAYYAEVKALTTGTRFPLKRIERPQWNAAKQATTAGGQYYFFVCTSYTTVYRIPAEFLLSYKDSSVPLTDHVEFLLT